MWHWSRLACLSLAAFLATAGADSPPKKAPAPPKRSTTAKPLVPAMAFNYDVPGQVHDDETLPVRAIVYSGEKSVGTDSAPEHELTYRVCNIEPGDKAKNREPAKLYFQWPDAGMRTSLQREVPFEWCVRMVRNVTANVEKKPSAILYTYDPTTIPLNDVWQMDWVPPWSVSGLYRHGVALYRELVKGISNTQEMFRIKALRKGPNEKSAYQEVGWRQGTELYLALPKLSVEEMTRYRAAWNRLEGQGVLFSILAGPEAARDFEAQETWVAESFGDREVLKVSVNPGKEKDNGFNVFQVEIPVSTLALLRLPVIQRDRATKQALYQALYIVSGT